MSGQAWVSKCLTKTQESIVKLDQKWSNKQIVRFKMGIYQDQVQYKMKQNRSLLGLVSLICLVAAVSSTWCTPFWCPQKPQTVPYVDLNRYAGFWYQQARIPVFYQWGCTNTTANYTLNVDGSINVDNKCIKDGKITGQSTTAYVQDSTNAKLRVEWIPGFKWLTGGYWIVRLGDADDYGYSVVSTPDYSNLWILSRQQNLDEDTYNKIIKSLKDQNRYRVNQLVRKTA